MDHFKKNLQHAIFLCLITTVFTVIALEIPFNREYTIQWGGGHVTPLGDGTQVQILIDQISGGGFRSKCAYGSGLFAMNIKVPRNERGIVTTFYLTSEPDNAQKNHDELDFEFVGGTPYILSTNIFADDSGHREQTFKLWFDPTLAFHQYAILWNQHQIVFFVDKIPIRVLKNDGKMMKYPKFPMYVQTSVWNATQWRGPPIWSHGPFIANFRGFGILGCPYDRSHPQSCYSPQFIWNAPKNWQLDPQQQGIYEKIKRNNMVFDYCKNGRNFSECY